MMSTKLENDAAVAYAQWIDLLPEDERETLEDLVDTAKNFGPIMWRRGFCEGAQAVIDNIKGAAAQGYLDELTDNIIQED